MRWISKVAVVAATLTLSAATGFAQAKECNDEFKTATYSKWYENAKTNQDVAYQAAVEYLTVCPNEPADNAYANALKKFKEKYEAANTKGKLGAQFKEAIDKRNYKDIVRIGTQYVATDPDNSSAYLWIGFAGWNDPSLIAEVVSAAKKAIELVEAGKSFEPFKTKELSLSSMNEVIARAALKTAPADAIPYLIKAAKYDNKNAQIYSELAAAYAEGPRSKLTEEYKQKQGPNQTETPESKLVLANLNEVIDRQIDATARAAALTTDAAIKKALMDNLAEDYKFRKGSQDGLNEFVAGILSKPLPDPPTPITILPTTPAGSGSGTAAGNPPPPASAAPAGPAPVKPVTPTSSSTAAAPKTGTSTTSTQSSTPTKPTASPTPKPKPRRSNHRRGH